MIWMLTWNMTVNDLFYFILFIYLFFKAMVNKILLNILVFFQIFFFWGGIDELGKLELESGT